MQQLTEENRLQIENLAKNFTTNTLAEEGPEHMCFTICYPLHLHLINNGFDNSIHGEHYYCTTGSGLIREPHFWLNLEDDKETIVDPTIRQFVDDAPVVFVGKKSEYYDEDHNYDFCSTYQVWKYMLLNKHPNSSKEFVKSLLSINLKALSILIKETEPQRYSTQSEFKMYFDGIRKALRTYCDEKENLPDPSLCKEFDCLLSKMTNRF